MSVGGNVETTSCTCISANMSKGAPKKPAAVIRADQKFVCAKAELYAFDHGDCGSKDWQRDQMGSSAQQLWRFRHKVCSEMS